MNTHGEQVTLAVAAIQERLVELGGVGVQIMGVTKAHGPWAIRSAHDAGLGHVGENYAQEVRDKADVLGTVRSAGVRVHFIGALQTNKVRMIAAHVDVVQSVDAMQCADGATCADAVQRVAECRRCCVGVDAVQDVPTLQQASMLCGVTPSVVDIVQCLPLL